MSARIRDYLDVVYQLHTMIDTTTHGIVFINYIVTAAGSIIQDARGPKGYFSEGDISFLIGQMDIERVYTHFPKGTSLRDTMNFLVNRKVFLRISEDRYRFNMSLIKPREFNVRPKYFSEIVKRRDAIAKIVESAEEPLSHKNIQNIYTEKTGEKWTPECEAVLQTYKCASLDELVSQLDAACRPYGVSGTIKFYYHYDSQKERWMKRMGKEANMREKEILARIKNEQEQKEKLREENARQMQKMNIELAERTRKIEEERIRNQEKQKQEAEKVRQEAEKLAPVAQELAVSAHESAEYKPEQAAKSEPEKPEKRYVEEDPLEKKRRQIETGLEIFTTDRKLPKAIYNRAITMLDHLTEKDPGYLQKTIEASALLLYLSSEELKYPELDLPGIKTFREPFLKSVDELAEILKKTGFPLRQMKEPLLSQKLAEAHSVQAIPPEAAAKKVQEQPISTYRKRGEPYVEVPKETTESGQRDALQYHRMRSGQFLRYQPNNYWCLQDCEELERQGLLTSHIFAGEVHFQITEKGQENSEKKAAKS